MLDKRFVKVTRKFLRTLVFPLEIFAYNETRLDYPVKNNEKAPKRYILLKKCYLSFTLELHYISNSIDFY